jgi:hypothetical protein
MVRNALCFILIVLSLKLTAQTDYIRPGLLKATASISPSFMLNHNVLNSYVTGFFEGYTDKRISLRGDVMWYIDGKVNSGTGSAIFDKGFRVYYGAFAHLNKSNFDVHVGLQPGLAIFQPLPAVDSRQGWQASPSVALHVGTTYYVWKIFNFFVDAAYVHNTLQGLETGAMKTDELLISAGLGLHINTIRPKK